MKNTKIVLELVHLLKVCSIVLLVHMMFAAAVSCMKVVKKNALKIIYETMKHLRKNKHLHKRTKKRNKRPKNSIISKSNLCLVTKMKMPIMNTSPPCLGPVMVMIDKLTLLLWISMEFKESQHLLC